MIDCQYLTFFSLTYPTAGSPKIDVIWCDSIFFFDWERKNIHRLWLDCCQIVLVVLVILFEIQFVGFFLK